MKSLAFWFEFHWSLFLRVQLMAWHWTGDKPLLEPMLPSSLMQYVALGGDALTHWGLNNSAAIFQTIFSNRFSWMKMYQFQMIFHWSLFPRVQYTSIGSDNGLAPTRRQATSHHLNQWWLVYWRIYVSLGLHELIYGGQADISQDYIFNCIFMNENIRIVTKIYSKGAIINVSIRVGKGLVPNRWQAIT